MASGKHSRHRRISRNLRDEIRRTVALNGLNHIVSKSSMKKTDMERALYDLFHGKDEVASLVKMCVEGEGQFSELFVKETKTVTTKLSSIETTKLRLKDVLSRTSNERYYAGEKYEITTAVIQQMTFKNDMLVTGRALLDSARAGFRHLKLAMSYADKMVDKEGKPLDPETRIEDILTFVLQLMWKESKGSSIDINMGDDEISREEPEELPMEVSDMSASDVPDGWMFPGWIAFVLWGPFVDQSKRLDLLKTSEGDIFFQHRRGRISALQKIKTESEYKIENISQCDSGEIQLSPTSFTIKEKISVAYLALQNQKTIQQRQESVLIALSLRERAVSAELDRAQRGAERKCPNFDERHSAWIRVAALETESDEIIREMAALSKSSSHSGSLRGINAYGSIVESLVGKSFRQENAKRQRTVSPSGISIINTAFLNSEMQNTSEDMNSKNLLRQFEAHRPTMTLPKHVSDECHFVRDNREVYLSQHL